jgi:hypothetical protein
MAHLTPVTFNWIVNKIIVAFIVITIVSCNSDNIHEKPDEETPKALEDKSYSSEIISARSYEDDLLESLYIESLEKNKDLKNLEKKLNELNENKNGARELFERYNNKSQNYYVAANNHTALIRDSLLKSQMIKVISGSLAKYNSSISNHHILLKTIDTRNMTLLDLHAVLKITKTLPLIEQYQGKELPSTKQFEGFIKKQNEAIKVTESQINKK